MNEVEAVCPRCGCYIITETPEKDPHFVHVDCDECSYVGDMEVTEWS